MSVAAEDSTPETLHEPARSPAWIEWGGWIGMVLLLLAFGARSFEWVERSAPGYVAVNVVGAALVAIVCGAKRAWPALALELAWIAISVAPLWRGA